MASADPSVPSWNNSWNTQKTCSNAEATREHHAFVHAVVCGMKLADPGITLLRNPGRLIFSPPLLSPDAVRPWASVWPSPLQRQLAEMLPQAAFDPKLSHNRNEIVELRQQGIHYRPLVWTADGRPHPAVTRTLQLSAKSRPRRWKHEIQIALLRRRAAMARAVFPNPSARAEWIFADIIDRALHHWGHVPALDVGPGDHHLDDSETDTAKPDDDDDIRLPRELRVWICVAIKSQSARFAPVRVECCRLAFALQRNVRCPQRLISARAAGPNSAAEVQQVQVCSPPALPRRYCRLVAPLCALLSANAGPDPQVVV